MKKYSVEFAFSEGYDTVEEWDSIDEFVAVEAESAEEAAKHAACTDGLENALFRVRELAPNASGELEKSGIPEFFDFI